MRRPVEEARGWLLGSRGRRSGGGWCPVLLVVVAVPCGARLLVTPLVALRRLVLVLAVRAVLLVILMKVAPASPAITPALRREGVGEGLDADVIVLDCYGDRPTQAAHHLAAA
jgi:hypothetical protein